MTKLQSVAIRFAKGFIAGGLASIAPLLTGGFTIHALSDLRAIGIALLVPFLTGGLLAIEKLLSWQDVPQDPVPASQS